MSRGVAALSNGVPSKGVRIASATALLLAERPGDSLTQAVVCHESIVDSRGHDEAVRHREAGAD